MREIVADVAQWQAQGRRAALARVVAVEGSGPRRPGAALAVRDDGRVVGSVAGGCVESAVVTEALGVLDGGDRRLLRYAGTGEDPFGVGVPCGGAVQVYVEPVPDVVADLCAALDRHEPVALTTVVAGPGRGGWRLSGDRPVTTGLVRTGDATVFTQWFPAPDRLLVFGAVDFTAALVRVAKVLGFHVTVCDARPVFATRERFPHADDVVVSWPGPALDEHGRDLGPSDAVCVLTHDPRFDVPAILGALATDVGYIGALGSRRTHRDRVARLRAAGVDDAGLARLHAPVGLDIGARTPEETAVSICSELIAVRAGRPFGPLSLTHGDGPIHA